MARKKRGRDPEKERFWRGAVRRQRRSGLKIREFCRREQLAESSFHAWRREIAKRDQQVAAQRTPNQATARRSMVQAHGASGGHASPGAPFAELTVAGGAWVTDDRLEIVFPRGVRVRVPGTFDRGRLAEVIELLEAGSC